MGLVVYPLWSDVTVFDIRTYLATSAFVIEGAESDGGEEDGDVEEDGCGHVLQQGFITADDTWGETDTNIWVIFNS